MILTLAGFAKSPDIATSMIHTLESVQVLNTVPGGGVMGGGVGVGGALVQPQAKEGSIQVQCCSYQLTNTLPPSLPHSLPPSLPLPLPPLSLIRWNLKR